MDSSVRSHAANVLPWDRTACGRKGPQAVQSYSVSCKLSLLILFRFCSTSLDISSDVGYLLSCGKNLESGPGGAWLNCAVNNDLGRPLCHSSSLFLTFQTD